MKKILQIFVIFLGILLFFCGKVNAQDLIFEFRNPAFGGNTFNYQWMLSSADAQNTFEEEADMLEFETDPLADFTEDLNRQILNNLSRQLVADQFGEEGLQEGTYVLGDYRIEISSTAQGLSVLIVDLATGNQTSIIIPYF
ncbi:MAG: curli assembly protein CsgF [Bacteroidetes bacterium]|nr:curli assembly protein CsgF [Bacteroidota bacterium]